MSISKWREKLQIVKLDTEGRRIIAVSDIHANLPYFKGLLNKLKFCDDDILIIDGDFLERGKYSLETLRFIMSLQSHGNCITLCGNCDTWADALDNERAYWAPRITNYMVWRGSGLMWDMLTALGVKITPDLDFEKYIPALEEHYKPELAFLRAMPHCVETPHYIFVHGGVKPGIPLEDQIGGECMKFDHFMTYGYTFDKWVIVGHWPVMLYLPDHVCANPIIDREHHVISIDGGCSLKDDGQLNGLIIPHEGSTDFTFEAFDRFPIRRVKSDQQGGGKSYYIRWGDNDVQVLRRGQEFSLVRHVCTGYEMEVLTKYLYSDDEFCKINDSTDLVLPLKAGDEVSVVEETSRGYLVKHHGTSGWYWGELI